jgi:hypothetical protein
MPKFMHLPLDVMRGHSRPKDGVATLAYDPRIHEATQRRKPYVVDASPWMAGSSPAMTNVGFGETNPRTPFGGTNPRNEPERPFWRNEPEIAFWRNWCPINA